MKTIEQAISEYRRDNCIDSRDLRRLGRFIPECDLESFGLSIKNEFKENYIPEDFTRNNVLKYLEQDLNFAFEKALDKRGISASLMFQVIRMWNWILEDGLENWPEDNYAMYGLPLFKATALKYGFDNPIGDDSGTEDKYNS